MPRQRSVLVLILVPAVVSLAVTMLILTLTQPKEPTPLILPTSESTSLIPPRATFPPQPTRDPSQAEGASEGGGQVAENPPTLTPTEPAEPECENPIHTVNSGEVLGAISEEYDVSYDDLVLINQMTDPTFDPDYIFVGQRLIIPVCGIPTPTPTNPPPDTAVPTRNIPSPIPTATNPPPGAVRVVISRVRNVGDITSESIEIVNQGSPVDLDGWTLKGSKGREEFTFPVQTLYSGGGVTIYTGVGENTPIVLFWGRDEAVWEIGETISLFDDSGDLQDEFVIGKD